MKDLFEVAVATESDTDRTLLQEASSDAGVECDRLRGNVDPATLMILVGSGSLIVGAVSSWLARHRRSGERSWGQVIDLRPSSAQLVARDKNLEFGQIVIITTAADGQTVQVRVETYDPDNDFVEVAKLVFGRLADGVARSREELTAAARDAIGDRGTVEELGQA